MVSKREFVFGGIFILMLIVSISSVFADGVPIFTNLVTRGNYSTTINFSCASSMENARNASLFYNASGGAPRFSENLTFMANTSGNQSVFENATLSINTTADGRTYNLTCMMANTSGTVVYSVATYNVTFDSTAPNVSAFFTTSNNGNYSNTIVLNVSVSDATMGLASVYFNISSVNGSVQYNFTKATNSTIYYNLTINTSLYTDGVYNVTVYANDTLLNNLNNSKWIKIRMDNINPTAAFSCTPSSVDVGAIVTCSCDPTDLGSGINSSSVVYTINPSTTTAGTFAQSCTFSDMVGKSGNASTSITLNSPSSGTGTGGGSSTWTKTVSVNEGQFTEGYTKSLGENERMKVSIEGGTHSIGITNVESNAVTLTIASDPVTATLSVGDERKFDLSADGYYDLYIKLNSIASNKADITIKSIKEKVTEESEAQEQSKEESVTGENQETLSPPAEEKSSSLWLWILIIVVVVIAIAIAVGIGMKKRK